MISLHVRCEFNNCLSNFEFEVELRYWAAQDAWYDARLDQERVELGLEPFAGRVADNLLAPLQSFVDRRDAADNLSARRRCHFCCVLFCCNFRLLTEN